MKRIVDEETLKRALAVLLANAPTWESETVFEAINVEYATAIESLAEALVNAPYDDLDRALEPSRAFVRGHDAGWSAAIAHTAAQVQPTACPTCGECEPRTGGCGTSPDDKRALCNRDTPPPAPAQGWKADVQKVRDALDPEDWCGDERMIDVLDRALKKEPCCKNMAAGASCLADPLPNCPLLAAAPQPAQRKPLTPREIELIDGMIEVQLHHAAQCDAMANRKMADLQKGWDMERVELLRKLKENT